ncbi:MAG TPA: LysR family transcriptional regulator [Steroidobacteraceae bacterium]|nr:LysR family transcriptional regulator [Steroidobacteraceae bacterium]
MLERSHLAIMRAVERQGSLTAAARDLHLTQSALSHAIGKLERAVGAPLWRREGRSLQLTQAGEHLLEVANRLLPQIEHAEQSLRAFARGTRGNLRIGMECHPCYQWLLKVVERYLPRWPDVDVDVKQRFRFGGIGALLDHEIDLVVTPDPEPRAGLQFVPVFDYEQVLVVGHRHPLARARHVEPAQLAGEVLISYPVQQERLDVFTLFLTPAGVMPREHRTVESTDLMLQMVAAGRGVAALPKWLVRENATRAAVVPVRLGRKGVPKQIHLGMREADAATSYLRGFIETARAARRQG